MEFGAGRGELSEVRQRANWRRLKRGRAPRSPDLGRREDLEVMRLALLPLALADRACSTLPGLGVGSRHAPGGNHEAPEVVGVEGGEQFWVGRQRLKELHAPLNIRRNVRPASGRIHLPVFS
jgi:hypothetical protein